MKSNNSRRFYLAGTLSLVALLVLSMIWVMSVGADHPPDEIGDLTSSKPVVSPDQANVASGDRTVAVTVVDEGLDETLFVGEGPNGETADFDQIIISFGAKRTFGDIFRVSLVDGDILDVPYLIIGDAADRLPLVDRDRDQDVDASDVQVVLSGDTAVVSIVRLFDATNGQLQLSADSNIESGDRFILRWATSGRNAGIAKVEGDSGEMFLALPESLTTGGQFEASIVISDEATINIGDVVHEQHTVIGGLLADRAFSGEQHSVASNLVVGDTFTVTLDFTPADIDGDGVAGVALDDITTGGAAAAIGAAYASGTSLPMVGVGNADIGDAFTLTYGRAVAAEEITIPALFVNVNTGDLTLSTGDTFAATLDNILEDTNDDGVITIADITTITDVTGGAGIGVATVTRGSAMVTFVVTTGGAATSTGGTFTVNYIGRFVQNETIPATGLQPNETQVITLENPPLRDANDNDIIDTGDITITVPQLSVDAVGGIPAGNDGTLTIRNTTANAVIVDTPFAVSYRGADQLTLSGTDALVHAPLQGAPTTADITDSLVVPVFGVSGDLYQVNEVDGATGLVRFGVLVDTPVVGTVIGISYAGSEQHAPPGVAQAIGDEFVILLENDVRDGADAGTGVGPADVVVVSGDVVVLAVTADQGAIKVQATAALGADEILRFAYVRPANFNPQNALAPGANRPLPVVSATSGTQTRITYEDANPNVDIELDIGIEADSPSFEAAEPVDGFSAANSGDVVFSIEISDVEAGVNADVGDTRSPASEVRYILHDTQSPPAAGAAAFAAPVREFVVTADNITEALGIFTATLALNSQNLLLINMDIISGFVTTVFWWVEAEDDAQNVAITDSDPDTDGDQPFVLRIDALASNLTDAFTGDWWDPAEGRIKGDRALAAVTGGSMDNSIRVLFNEAIDALSITPAAFVIEGFTVTSARNFPGAPNSVFLTVSPDLGPSDVPAVSLVGQTVTDLAGNPANTGDETPIDGISPTPSVVPATTLSTGTISITVTTDENIRTRRPPLTLSVTADSTVRPGGVNPTAITPSADADEWLFEFTIPNSQTYSVVVTADDTARNQGVAGVANPEADGAIIFQIDNALPAAVTDPADGDDLPIAEFVFVSLNWSTTEENEYNGDTHTDVNLTIAILDSGDAGERDLMAEGVASVRNGNEWSLGIANVSLGEHTLTFNGADDAGNTLTDADKVLNFTVTQPLPFERELRTGMNLISLPGDPSDGSVDAVFGDIPQVNLVFTREGDRWLVGERGPDGTFGGNLTNIDSSHGYWVRATAGAALSVQIPPLGALEIPPEIPVVGGRWNLVSVISLEPVGTVVTEDTLVSADTYLGTAWTRAFAFDGRVWIRVERGDELQFGNGYWVFFTADGTLVP